jgi:hypothetical protein
VSRPLTLLTLLRYTFSLCSTPASRTPTQQLPSKNPLSGDQDPPPLLPPLQVARDHLNVSAKVCFHPSNAFVFYLKKNAHL